MAPRRWWSDCQFMAPRRSWLPDVGGPTFVAPRRWWFLFEHFSDQISESFLASIFPSSRFLHELCDLRAFSLPHAFEDHVVQRRVLRRSPTPALPRHDTVRDGTNASSSCPGVYGLLNPGPCHPARPPDIRAHVTPPRAQWARGVSSSREWGDIMSPHSLEEETIPLSRARELASDFFAAIPRWPTSLMDWYSFNYKWIVFENTCLNGKCLRVGS